MNRNLAPLFYFFLFILLGVAGYYFVVMQPTSKETKPQNFSYECQKDKTAFEMLESSYPVQAQDSSLGKFVTGINGVKASPKQFWAFYVSDKTATVGASTYICQDHEKIDWKLEEIK